MSYWSSGYSGVLDVGEIPRSGAGHVVGPKGSIAGAFAGDVDRDLFRSFAVSGWTTSRRKRIFDALVATPALVAARAGGTVGEAALTKTVTATGATLVLVAVAEPVIAAKAIITSRTVIAP